MPFYKFQPNAQLHEIHEIHGNQVISAHANFSGHQKFLVAFDNENLFVDAVAKGHFSGYVSLPKNFSATPAAIFALPIDTEKLIKAEGQFLVKLTRVSIQDSTSCCTFQLSLVYNRVCWDFV
jgi:hypothetical protein